MKSNMSKQALNQQKSVGQTSKKTVNSVLENINKLCSNKLNLPDKLTQGFP